MTNDSVELETIEGEDFNGKIVVLDGKKFVNCSFIGAALEFNGGSYELHNCACQKGGVTLHSKHPAICGFMNLLKLVSPITEQQATSGNIGVDNSERVDLIRNVMLARPGENLSFNIKGSKGISMVENVITTIPLRRNPPGKPPKKQ